MHVLLLRHGQTDENVRGVLQGHSDTRLNALGRAQAAALAERLRAFAPPLRTLVTSDLARAQDTARTIAARLDLTLRLDAAWRERRFGPHEGQSLDAIGLWSIAGGSPDLPGAEPPDEFRDRIRDALLQLAGAFPGVPCVGVVTHGGPIRTVLRLLADGGLPTADTWNWDPVPVPNCAIAHLWLDRRAWRVIAVNDTAHLAGLVETACARQE